MITWLAMVASASAQDGCLALSEVPQTTQVIWVSKVGKRASGKSWLEVSRLADIEAWVADHGRDGTRLLQTLGLAKRKARAAERKEWKVTIFDVESSWMCRPIDGQTPGTEVEGIQVCDEKQQGKKGPSKHGYSGCGYTIDTGAGARGIDVFRVTWNDAASQGFCVMPLERFLSGL